MQQEKDYLQRDIERITLFLKQLLRKIAGLRSEDVKPQYDQLEKDLKEQVDFSISDLNQLNEDQLNEKIAVLHLSHVEKLVEIAFEIFKKVDSKNEKRFIRNILLMIEHLNKQSDTFSIKRQHIKGELQRYQRRQKS